MVGRTSCPRSGRSCQAYRFVTIPGHAATRQWQDRRLPRPTVPKTCSGHIYHESAGGAARLWPPAGSPTLAAGARTTINAADVIARPGGTVIVPGLPGHWRPERPPRGPGAGPEQPPRGPGAAPGAGPAPQDAVELQVTR